LEVLKPVFERMRTEGADFLQRNSALAEEVRRTFVELDEIENELKKAAKSIETVSGMTVKYRTRLQALCDNVSRRLPQRELDGPYQTPRESLGEITWGENAWIPMNNSRMTFTF